MFIFVLKTRESDTPYKNLFIKKMDLNTEQLDKMKQSVISIDKLDFSKPTPVFSTPVFETETKVEDLISLPSFADLQNKDKDSPF